MRLDFATNYENKDKFSFKSVMLRLRVNSVSMNQMNAKKYGEIKIKCSNQRIFKESRNQRYVHFVWFCSAAPGALI